MLMVDTNRPRFFGHGRGPLTKMDYWGSQSFLPLRQIFSSRKRRPLFWCVRFSVPSRSSRRLALLRNSQQLASASVIAMDGAKGGSRSARPDLRLLLLSASYEGVGPKAGRCPCAKFRSSLPLMVFSMSVVGPTPPSLWQACWPNRNKDVCGWAKGLLITGNPPGHDLNAMRRGL